MNTIKQIINSSFISELNKIAIDIQSGKQYPSPEMKKEYDAANDCEHEDLDAATNYSPKYPTEHINNTNGAKTAALAIARSQMGFGQTSPSELKEEPTNIKPEPSNDDAHGEGEARSYD